MDVTQLLKPPSLYVGVWALSWACVTGAGGCGAHHRCDFGRECIAPRPSLRAPGDTPRQLRPSTGGGSATSRTRRSTARGDRNRRPGLLGRGHAVRHGVGRRGRSPADRCSWRRRDAGGAGALSRRVGRRATSEAEEKVEARAGAARRAGSTPAAPAARRPLVAEVPAGCEPPARAWTRVRAPPASGDGWRRTHVPRARSSRLRRRIGRRSDGGVGHADGSSRRPSLVDPRRVARRRGDGDAAGQ